MCLAALVILVVQSRRVHRSEDLYVNRVRAEKAEAAPGAANETAE